MNRATWSICSVMLGYLTDVHDSPGGNGIMYSEVSWPGIVLENSRTLISVLAVFLFLKKSRFSKLNVSQLLLILESYLFIYFIIYK